MSNLVLVFICLFLGLAFQRLKSFSENSASVLNNYVIYVALPALILNEIPKLVLDQRTLMLVLIAWLVMIFAALLTFFTAKYFKWSRPITGAMLLVVTLGNTSFVGIPLIEAHLGSAAIPYAILYDQLGTFLALNTLGVLIASLYSDSSKNLQSVVINIVKFPPFIALCFTFALIPFGYPQWFSDTLPRLASTLVPVVMVAVGLQWKLRLEREYFAPLSIALIYILLLQPAFALIITKAFGLNGLVADSIVLEAAMPAMISAGVLATVHNLAPRLAASIVGYSLALSLVTVWMWKLLIS